jgi:heptosyltransferase I
MAPPALPFAEPPASLFVLRFSALGDVSHMVPVVRSIQTQWPSTRITWCVARLEHRLVGDLPGVEFVTFDKSGGLDAFRSLRRQLAGRHFDALMHAQFSMRSNLASLTVRAPIRLGYDRDRSKDLHGFFVNRRIPPGAGQHVVDSYFSFAETLGVTHRELRWDIPVSDEDRAFAKTHLPAGERYVLISPCSSHPLRNWLADRYAAVADFVQQRLDRRVVLVGGPTDVEREAGAAIAGRMQTRPLNLIGKDTIKQLLGMLERAEVLITPDSGPMHLATAVGTPVIGLHAASNPARSGPYLSQQWCVNRYDDAARRYLGRPADALKWGTKIEREGVMALVTVDDVIERLEAFVARGPQDEPVAGRPASQTEEQDQA